MFQPQATPYSPFASYGAAGNIADFSAFQQSQLQQLQLHQQTAARSPSMVLHSHPHPHPHRRPHRQPRSAAPAGGPTTITTTTTTTTLPRVRCNNTNSASASGSALTLPRNSPHYRMTATDLDEQEALARTFQPDLQGPLVGEKKSSHAITEEYAKADPVYVAKTAALPQTYSHYRPILGDGNCGWRAAGFSYFEALVRLGSKTQLEGEIARMMSLDNLLATAGGFDMELLEFMVEETTTLLTELAAAIHDPPLAEGIMFERWNDPNSSAGIMYHLRMLASSWLKGHPDNYIGFIPGENGIEGYCKGTLEVTDTEIDHLGMSLLIDVLLKPIGIAVEIVYLDRSQGSHVNSHMFQVEEHPYANSPVIHLLYRPSHYDILYKDEIPSIPHPDVQVNRAASFSQQLTIQGSPSFSGDISALLSIPGFTPAPSLHFPYSPISASISPVSSTPTNLSLAPNFPQSLSPLNTSFPTTLPMHPVRPDNITTPLASSFRPSKYEWEAAAADWQEPVAFQTATFKNSHYNKAHYNNPDFQPEEWNPDCEELGGMGAARKRSH